MNFSTVFLVLLCSTVVGAYHSSKKQCPKRGQAVIKDDVYNALINIVEGKELPPVKERSKAEKAAIVRYWRYKGELTVKTLNGMKCLYYRGRRMVRSNEIHTIVSDQFDRSKGSGATKIACSLKDDFVGVSRKQVQNILNTDKRHYKRNAKFSNKATLKPIIAKNVHVRHQLDLMDMGKRGTAELNGVNYRYIISLMDIFSRFVWLRPLKTKDSKVIARELQKIYIEHGAPCVIQCDQGSEFKGAIKKLSKKLKVKIICSRPYHPQSQGKVERSHRSLRSKISYDVIKMGTKGINWAENLPIYQGILNEDPKEVIGYKTPFEVYFGRKCNVLQSSLPDNKELVAVSSCMPTKKDIKQRFHHLQEIRAIAKRATHRCAKRMIRTYARSHPPSKYNIGENIHLRLPQKGGLKSKRRVVVEGVVIKRNIKRHLYKISFVSPTSQKNEQKWFPVDDITSLTLREEKRKQRLAKFSKSKKRKHFKKYYITMETNEYQREITNQGYVIVHNPVGDGSCQFAALANQLQNMGVHRSAKTLREEIVQYLRENSLDNDGFPLLELVPEFENWNDYIAYMSRENTFGDQITLFAASQLFNINVHIISSLGAEAQHVFHPSSTAPIATVYLGHFAETHGEHYVSLLPTSYYQDQNNDFEARLEDSSASNNDESEVDQHHHDDSTNLPFLNNDVLEHIIKITLTAFPFMRVTLSAVSTFFKAVVDKVSCPRVYLPDLKDEATVISVQKIIMLKGQGSGAVAKIMEEVKSPQWKNAWLKLVPQEYGWFNIVDIFWK